MLPLKPPNEEAFKVKLPQPLMISTNQQDSTDRYEEAAEKLLETHTATDLVAALLNNMTKEAASEAQQITPERPPTA